MPEASYDVIAVVGGLHHVVNHLDAVMSNIHAALKPGGILVMMEPNAKYFLELVRRIWYRMDPLFDEKNEAAIAYPRFLERYESLFEEVNVRYAGGPAYYLVLSSLVLRVPHRLKRLYSPAFIASQTMWNKLPRPQFHAFFVAQWRRHTDG
jgi:SAM-dependent methyltransferase